MNKVVKIVAKVVVKTTLGISKTIRLLDSFWRTKLEKKSFKIFLIGDHHKTLVILQSRENHADFLNFKQFFLHFTVADLRVHCLPMLGFCQKSGCFREFHTLCSLHLNSASVWKQQCTKFQVTFNEKTEVAIGRYSLLHRQNGHFTDMNGFWFPKGNHIVTGNEHYK